MLEELPYSPTPATRDTLPQIAPSPDFRLGVHPRRWHVDLQMGRLVPDLVIIPCVPGAFDVERASDLDDLIRTHERQGWTILDPDEYGAVAPGKHYVRKVRVAKGAAHIPAWSEPIPGTARSRIDRRAYERFLAHVITIVPPPDPSVLQQGLRQAEEAYERHAQRSLTHPLSKRAADQWARRAELWRVALEGDVDGELDEDPEPSLEPTGATGDLSPSEPEPEPEPEPKKKSSRK